MIDIRLGDCFELIKDLPDNSVDLVITSPPYSNILSYGKNVSVKKPGDYVDWLLPLFHQIHRVLKPTGSFILNINDNCEGGYRNTYVFDLISRNAKETPLKLYDNYAWVKPNSLPNGQKKRFRNITEYIFHFCKDSKQMKFYMDRVLIEPQESTLKKQESPIEYNRYNYDDDGRRISKKLLFRKKAKSTDENGVSNDDFWMRYAPIKIRPTNVFNFPTASASRDNLIKHPAPFHKDLPCYFINLLTDKGDTILDVFAGIGTTGLCCDDREFIGYELNPVYADFATKRLSTIQTKLEL